MLLYHQAGFRLVWNMDAYTQDNSGDGFIFSPVNDSPDRILSLDRRILGNSLLDPQFYAPASERGKLQEYPFFPRSMLGDFDTVDFEAACYEVALACVRWQVDAGFSRVVIPTRYHDDFPADYLEQMLACYIEPFKAAKDEIGFVGDLILTVIVKPGQLKDDDQRNYLLNWITGLPDIAGVYLIFEHNSPSKQIKDPTLLGGCLLFIRALKDNDLKVHIGYTNTEGLLFSIAGPDSISMGIYENLRKFDPRRFEEQEPQQRRPPNPRLYSRLLMQWIEFGYVQAIQQLYPGWRTLFEESAYTPTDFRPGRDWNLRQPELYKHFFLVFSGQVRGLQGNLEDRFDQLREMISQAQNAFRDIAAAGIALDESSDGSHLAAWTVAMALYRRVYGD